MNVQIVDIAVVHQTYGMAVNKCFAPTAVQRWKVSKNMDIFTIILLSSSVGFALGYAMNCIFSVAKDADELVRKLEERKDKEK